MTPDEYRRKYKSCWTCEYYQEHKTLTTIKEKCLVKNRNWCGCANPEDAIEAEE